MSNLYPAFSINGSGGGTDNTGVYRGTWEAATNTPTLANSIGEVGDYYINISSGTNLVDFGAGDISFNYLDIAKLNSDLIWQNAGTSSGSVLSWNGESGVVIAPMNSLSDVSAPTPLNAQILIRNGTTNQYVNQSLSNEATMDETGAVTLQGSPSFTAVTSDTFNVGGTDFTLSLLGGQYPLLKWGGTSTQLYNSVDQILTTFINGTSIISSNINGTTFSSNQNQVVTFQAGNTGPSGTTSTNFRIQENTLTPLFWDVGIIGSGSSISSGTGNFYLSSDGVTNQFQLDPSGNMTLSASGYATNFTSGLSNVVSSASPIILTSTSLRSWVISGTSAQTFNLPDATTLRIGATFIFNNNSTGGSAFINNYNNGSVVTVARGAWVSVVLTDNSGANTSGIWDYHSQLPANATFGLTGLTYSGGTVSFANGNFSATTNQITLGTSSHQTILTAPAPSGASVTATIVAGGNSNTVIPSTGSAGQFATGISSAGVISYTTPTGLISGLTTNGALYASSATAISSTAALTNGQLLIGNTGSAPVAATLTGTSNQVNVTNGAGTITLSLPQNINSGAAPTFVGTNFNSIPNSATTATNANTASTIVARDGSGNFSAGTITASLSGTATNATNVAISTTSTNATYYVPFVSSSSAGNQALFIDAGGDLNYSPFTNTLTCNLSGPASALSGGGVNRIPYNTATATTSFMTAAANSVLVTNGSNVPSLSTTLPTAVQGNITSLGNIGNTNNTTRAAFAAINNADQAITKGVSTTIAFNTEEFDQNNNFASNTFTAPVTGIYIFNVTLGLNNMNGLTAFQLNLITTTQGIILANNIPTPETSGGYTITGSAIVKMTASDTAIIQVYGTGGTSTFNVYSGNQGPRFSGYLLA
jgi:hypothetical protein